MDTKPITVLDGSAEEREAIMKDFFGLSPEQSFQDIKVDDEENSD
nr:MAG TPA: hypothetical protein [Caudoviricetes sp.]